MMYKFLCLILWLPLFASAQLKVANIFASHMVVQRNKPITVWGQGTPGSLIHATLGEEQKEIRVDKDSSWRIVFSARPASGKAISIHVQDHDKEIVFTDVLVGDIWLCSGQSNIEWPLAKEAHYAEEKAMLNQPNIRFYNPSPAGRYVYGIAYTDSLLQRLTPERFYEGTWQRCDSQSAPSMSAIGYYFARVIEQKEHIPVGIINLSIGGAPIETFISENALLHSRFSGKVKGNWLYNDSLPAWIRQRGLENVGSHPEGYGDELGINHAYKPGFAFQSGIEPILSFPITGVLWYQGESNSLEENRVMEYGALQKLLIQDYRTQWHNPNMPFYWVQLSSVDTPYYASQYWPQFRDEQRRLLDEIPYGGMAVCSDIGLRTGVHPTHKKEVGERLARWALCKTYNESVLPSGPLPVKANYRNGQVTIAFQYAGKGLATSNGKELHGFSLDGKKETIAEIKQTEVVIPCSHKPAFVYYAWQPYPDANLINTDSLPASTFKMQVL